MQLAILVKCAHPFWKEVEMGAKAAAQKYNFDLIFDAPIKEDYKHQIPLIEDFIKKGIKGIAFSVSNPEALAPVIKKAVEQGIPCLAIDTDSPKTARYFYVGTNNYLAGKIAGDTMKRYIGMKGKVIIGTGSLTAQNSQDRIQGFKDALKSTPEIQIIDTLIDEENEAKALNLAQETLIKHTDLQGFFGVFGWNGPVFAKALKLNRKTGIKIVCFDTLLETIQFIKEGIINATIAQRPYTIGYRSMQFLYDINRFGLENVLKSVPATKIIDTGVDIVNKENLDDYKKSLERLGIPINF